MSSIRLFILDTLARHGEMHGHQLRLQAEEEHVHLWTDISVGGLYGAIKRLAAEGLVEVVRVEREGNFPERQVYAITDAGRQDLTTLRVVGLLTLGHKNDPFDLALSRLDKDRLHELPGQIATRLASLEDLLAETVIANARARPYLTLAETHALGHREHRLRSEVAWHKELIADMGNILADEQAREPEVPAYFRATASAPS